ncbi:maleylpyruvate isomerase family mycothiol-dependent enzyme [Calidifontibacter terrae]
MATHPAAPTELSRLIEAYSNTTQAVLELGLTCHDADFDTPTQCPGWTVKDQISHVVGLESTLGGAPAPDIEVPQHPWIKNEFGAFMETHVEARRSTPGAEVVRELQELLPARLAHFHELLVDPDQLVPGPAGERPARDSVFIRVIDIWCHEQDIREALDRPGNLDSPGAAAFTQQVLDAVAPRAVKVAKLPVGTTVIIEATGPVQARGGVRIVSKDGKPYGEALFSGEPHDAGVEGDVTTIRLTTEALTRRGAGRVSTADLRYHVEGDADVAVALLDALAITP